MAPEIDVVKRKMDLNTFSHSRNRGSDVYGVAKAVDDVAQGVGVLEDLVGQAVVVLSPVRLLV